MEGSATPARARIQPAANQALWQTAAHEGGHSTRLSATTRTRQCKMQHQPRNYSYQTHRSQLQGWNLVLLALWQSCRFHEDECTMCGGQSRAPLESSASDGRCQRPVACVLTCFSTRASLSISQRASFLTSHQMRACPPLGALCHATSKQHPNNIVSRASAA